MTSSLIVFRLDPTSSAFTGALLLVGFLLVPRAICATTQDWWTHGLAWQQGRRSHRQELALLCTDESHGSCPSPAGHRPKTIIAEGKAHVALLSRGCINSCFHDDSRCGLNRARRSACTEKHQNQCCSSHVRQTTRRSVGHTTNSLGGDQDADNIRGFCGQVGTLTQKNRPKTLCAKNKKERHE